MKIHDFLQQMQFGNPVAEFDRGLENYFFVTDAFRYVTSSAVDIIAGDKGTGKTAIYQHLKRSYKQIPELDGVEIIAGFNPSGEPLFRRLGDEEKMTEGQYITVWKMYFLSLAGNWLLKKYRGQNSPAQRKLEDLLSKLDLLSIDDSVGTIFNRLLNWLHLNATPRSIGMDFSFNEFGVPCITPRIELGEGNAEETKAPEIISHKETFDVLVAALKEKKITLWIVMDRLDEAFVGRPDIEALALRALIRTFMDLDYINIGIKLFVRNDLFRKITRRGFVNLTHVNARRKEIIWDDEDLLVMLGQRIKNNAELFRTIGINTSRTNNHHLLDAIFVHKVSSGRYAPTTWHWMLNQIQDGNWIKSPRNLIDLCIMAQEEQLRSERRAPREYKENIPLIEKDALKKAAVRLSKQRIEDTLMAEYGEDVKIAIKAFRNGKAEHDEESLAILFGVDVAAARLIATVLNDVGFLEQCGDLYKVPPLYRLGLNITKGRGFPTPANHQRSRN